MRILSPRVMKALGYFLAVPVFLLSWSNVHTQNFLAVGILLFIPLILLIVLNGLFARSFPRTNYPTYDLAGSYFIGSVFPWALLFVIWNEYIWHMLIPIHLLVTLIAWKASWYWRKVIPRFSVITAAHFAIVVVLLISVPDSKYLHFDRLADRDWDQGRMILEQKGVTSIVWVSKEGDRKILTYQGGRTENYSGFDPYMIRCIQGRYLYASYERRHMVEKIDLDSMTSLSLPTANAASFFMLDPMAGRGIAGGFIEPTSQARLIVFDAETMTQIANPSLGRNDWSLGEFPMDGFRNGVFLGESGFVVTFRGRMIRLSSSMLPESMAPASKKSHIYSSAYHPGDENFYLILPLAGIREVGWKDFKIKRLKPLFWSFWIEFPPENDFFVTNDLLGILIVDKKTFKTRKRIWTGLGIRSLALDSSRRRVYAPNFLTGELTAYNYITGEKIGSVETGPLLRAVSYFKERDTVFAGSSRGIFEIRPEAFGP